MMRILFAGSPGIAVPSLEALAAFCRGKDQGEWELAGVLTNPDSPQGRGNRAAPTELAHTAAGLSLPALKPERLNAEAREMAAALVPDLLVSFAYGHIFGPRFLALFPQGGINIHPSLLPKYRGASPMQAAILNRDAETGITIQRLAAEMDAGDILRQERFPLSGRETTAELSEVVAARSASLLIALLRDLAAGTAEERPQGTEGLSYAPSLRKESGRIDWTRSAVDIDARIRAYTPWPLSWTTREGERLYILRGCPYREGKERGDGGTVLGIDKKWGILIQTGDGIFAAMELQFQARKALPWREFLNGAPGFIGSRLR